MQTKWDYTVLSKTYHKRPDYSEVAICRMLKTAGVGAGNDACDIGAGVAHLTLMLAMNGLNVVAVEPNDAMRERGMARTADLPNVRWVNGTGEETGLESSLFDLVTFGSSFNVTDRWLALQESARLLKVGGWFVCMWNHRDLDDLIQATIERIIKQNIPDYDYGTRREDQTDVIKRSNLFGEVFKIEGEIVHEQPVDDCVEAWRSHATLHRQAGDKFRKIINEIKELLVGTGSKTIKIPYTTRIWMARVKKEAFKNAS